MYSMELGSLFLQINECTDHFKQITSRFLKSNTFSFLHFSFPAVCPCRLWHWCRFHSLPLHLHCVHRGKYSLLWPQLSQFVIKLCFIPLFVFPSVSCELPPDSPVYQLWAVKQDPLKFHIKLCCFNFTFLLWWWNTFTPVFLPASAETSSCIYVNRL